MYLAYSSLGIVDGCHGVDARRGSGSPGERAIHATSSPVAQASLKPLRARGNTCMWVSVCVHHLKSGYNATSMNGRECATHETHEALTPAARPTHPPTHTTSMHYVIKSSRCNTRVCARTHTHTHTQTAHISVYLCILRCHRPRVTPCLSHYT